MGRTARSSVVWLTAVTVSLSALVHGAEPPLDFNRDVRPLLSDRCFACHGPDGEDRHAGLRLDLRETATAALESGAVAVVPANAAASELFARITSTDPDLVMPPPHVGKPITPAEARILDRWIAAGAEYRGHWAFERVEQPALPEVRDGSWAKTPLDRFILARLEAEGIAPAPEADRVTLARRLALDLTGLPPAPEAVGSFLADTAPDAYERYVDSLLASPHFGERMAIEWLDAARYADSHGYQTDSSRSNWPWRDWLIRAFNENLSFDQFTVDQLAGDMLENPTRDQIVATGFNRNHRINGEGGIIAEEWRVETVIDRVETTGQTWLGLTVGCSRCHDHKYDPLSQREFYALFALFNNVPETGSIMGSQNRAGGNSDPLFEIPSPEQEGELARLNEVVADAEAAVKAEGANIDPLVREWEASLGPLLGGAEKVWDSFEPLELRSAGGATFRRIEDGSWLVEGANPPFDTYEFEALLPGQSFGGVRLEVIPDPTLIGIAGPNLPDVVAAALAVDRDTRSPQQQDDLRKFYREKVDGPIKRAEAARDAAKKSLADFRNTLPTAMVMNEGPARDAFLLVRGEYDKRGEKVPPGLPAFLPAVPEGMKADRLGLARWIVSRDNPLTARVQVNRLWERFFGTGIVKTSENLGSQAEYPSHPELLDWMAAEFMEGSSLPAVGGKPAGPWDTKAFVKLLVSSAVYRQSAVVTPEKLARDPANRLLARAPRIRLPGEVVRDQAVAAAGLLVPTIGGPSVRPWMPDGVWDETSKYGDLRGYKPDTGPGRYRRTMYTIWKRTAAPPTMLLFDAPNRETCQVKRSRTNTPLQALALLNETTFIEAAHGLARRMLGEGGDTPATRISHGFRLAIGRPPSDSELVTLVVGFGADREAFAADPDAAGKYAGYGLVKPPEGIPPEEFAAYSLAANVIINLDEFVMRE
ncbi:MAG: PSD1 and planctomycete cytochrome C domain-containing protein [Pirellulales bacterium]